MEELQLLVEAKLYDQPVEKLKEVCQYLKITVETGLSKVVYFERFAQKSTIKLMKTEMI